MLKSDAVPSGSATMRRGGGGGEADMWAAMVKLAFADACEPVSPTMRATNGCTPREAAEAWDFLTAQTGQAAGQRKWVAGINGIDETILTAEAIRRGPSRQLRAYRCWIAARAGIKGRDREIVAAYEKGRTLEWIAEAHSVHRSRVAQIVAQAGVKRRSPGRVRKAVSA